MKTLNLDVNKRYTYADCLSWQDDTRRELYNGFIRLMSPAPKHAHQKISGIIFIVFGQYLKNKKCGVYAVLFDVRIPTRFYKEPN